MIGFDADQDCSRIASAAYAVGARWIGRYFKNLHQSEVEAIHAAGLGVVLIFETSAERALGGTTAGRQDGAASAAFARALGAPQGTGLYLTADFDVTEAQQPSVLTYTRAFAAASALGYRHGAYANGSVCAAVLDAGIASYTWVAGGKGMRGTREFIASGRATIVQDVGDAAGLNLGIGIDSDTAKDGDIGAWLPGVPPPFPAVLTRGDVRLVQAAMIAAGYDCGDAGADGLMGPDTSAAISAYCVAHGIAPAGIDAALWRALFGG